MIPELDDLSAIQACIRLYQEGSARGDRKLLEQAFLPSARMAGWFEGKYLDVPITSFFEIADGNAQSEAGYRSELQSIQITGSAAVATLVENSYLEHDFTDYFSLIKTEEGWKIANKVFHGKPAE